MEGPERSRESMRDRGTELGDVARELFEESQTQGPKHITGAPREYRIRLPITPKALEDVSILPFEIFLSEHDAGTTLVTGVRRGLTPEDRHTDDRLRKEARYTLHNHPHEVAASPSDGDLWVSRSSKSDVDFIVGLEGITVHKLSYDSDLRISNRNMSKAVASWRGGDHAVTNDVARGYADAWIPWEDSRIQEICDYMNGEVEWSDIKERMH